MRAGLRTACLLATLGAWSCSRSAGRPPGGGPARISVIEIGRALGPDRRVSEKTELFGRNDVVYLSVVVGGRARRAVLTTSWVRDPGMDLHVSSVTLFPVQDSVAEFHRAQPGGWNPGHYRVDVSLEGVPAASRDFWVRP